MIGDLNRQWDDENKEESESLHEYEEDQKMEREMESANWSSRMREQIFYNDNDESLLNELS